MRRSTSAHVIGVAVCTSHIVFSASLASAAGTAPGSTQTVLSERELLLATIPTTVKVRCGSTACSVSPTLRPVARDSAGVITASFVVAGARPETCVTSPAAIGSARSRPLIGLVSMPSAVRMRIPAFALSNAMARAPVGRYASGRLSTAEAVNVCPGSTIPPMNASGLCFTGASKYMMAASAVPIVRDSLSLGSSW